ncbi:hypothetical protein HRR83_005673 [Exophiala dermatitidis]|uniref:Major facilitator superfamily (MFS) profile domain-containing protein n=2 Tax=Exophiala dermatitidis TaxID=5970 RepID=H6BVL2_EXODN|nr:uncharacterized protein HMPREF1120_03227 [Exophiala dermatitidis NIH/UT8656]KAJ4508056.1 hypothetical protein HRR73_007494 [Exophiala dermatitidis]EHY55071.1 hypothetical protein HMPREF1120_03227 [Exophiala dermatitidis NIH/UT8656]KAJ4510839.1 hypothetical protein HRR75_005533 [Exophiala dermatitidis]KAJ4513229.1 hypothetical protein HRR74_006041 [Exophiala dermatitidis]KAJ4532012.1 hypothetical protein HRR77_008973 [Exophiala dermatitidis]
MGSRSKDKRPLVDPTATQGPFIQPGLEDPNAPQPTETTSLLTKPKTSEEKAHDVHYRNISGRRFRFLFCSILFGSTIAFFDTTLMASAHPVITSYFHASNAASWVSTVFYLTSTVFQPLYGRLSDTLGRRPVFLTAIVMFFVSTALCGAASDIGSFIAARAICGLGAGGVIAMAGILTSDVVKIEYRGIYQSYFNVAFGMGNGLGAALGGFLCDHFGWRAAFYLQLPFIFIYGFLAYLSCPEDLGPNLAKTQGKTIREAFKTFDTLGAITLTVTVTCLILGVNLGGNVFTWGHPLVISSLILSAVSGVLLSFVERKAEFPMLPLRLLSTIPNGNLMWSNFFGAIATNTILFNVPLYLQAVRQTSPTASGLFLVSPLIGVSVTAVFIGFYITATRRMKGPMTIGTSCMLLGTILVTCLRADTPMWLVPILIPFCSIGQGFFFPAATIAVLALNSQNEQAVVTTTLGLLRNLGAINGVAISSWILQNALLVYLDRSVSAQPDQETKARIIATVRKSIASIRDLDPLHKGEVINAYAQSLRVTFAVGIIFTVLSICLVWPIRLPRLQGEDDLDTNQTSVFAPVAEDGTVDYYDDDEEVIADDDEDGGTIGETSSLGVTRTMSSIYRTATNRSVRTARSAARTFADLERRPSFDMTITSSI